MLLDAGRRGDMCLPVQDRLAGCEPHGVATAASPQRPVNRRPALRDSDCHGLERPAPQLLSFHGKDYGVAHIGGMSFADNSAMFPWQVFVFESGSASPTNTTSTIIGCMRSAWKRRCRRLSPRFFMLSDSSSCRAPHELESFSPLRLAVPS